MPDRVNYTPRPYVRDRYERNSTLAELMMRQGRNAADAELRRGEISGQMWANVGNTVANTVNNVMQAKQDEPRRRLLEENASLENEARRMGIDSAKGDAATKKQVQDAIAQIKSGNAEAVLSQLNPQARALAEKWLVESGQTRQELKALKIRDVKQAAQFVRGAGYDPTITEVVIGLMAEEYPEAKSIMNRVGGDPEILKRIIDAYADYGDEPQKLMERDPTKDLTHPTTGQVVVPGTQKTEPVKKYQITVPGPAGRPITKLVTEDELAKGVLAYREPKETKDDPRFWVMRNGTPIRVTEAEYRQGDTPAGTREQGRPVTSGDAGRIADFDTSLSDLGVLKTTLTDTEGATGTMASIGAAMPAWATDTFGWGTDAKKRQGVIDRVKQVIGKTLEGGVLRKEDEIKYEKILPTIKDTAEVAKSKLAGLDTAIKQRRSTFIDALGDANYDITKFNARTPVATDGPKVGEVRTSNGETREWNGSEWVKR